jgi:hypothetical protein
VGLVSLKILSLVIVKRPTTRNNRQLLKKSDVKLPVIHKLLSSPLDQSRSSEHNLFSFVATYDALISQAAKAVVRGADKHRLRLI